MALIPLTVPPGVVRVGTELQSAGRYYDANLVRWVEGVLQPIGGWQKIQYNNAGTQTDVDLTGVPRGMVAWRSNNGNRWLAVGTPTKLYALEGGYTPYDITPSGLTAGATDSANAVGYGNWVYGRSTYGTARPNTTLTGSIPATTWSLDNWGEYLLACSSTDGKIYEWQLNTGTDAAVISAAPTNNVGIVVTQERFVFALGAGGNPRKVAWCDQEDNTTWTPSATNQAGDFELQTSGRLTAGVRLRDGTLLVTDTDAHLAVYIGTPFVYSFQRVGSACGAVSKLCVATFDTAAVWMGESSFYLMDGYVKPLPCDVQDYVFSDINRGQMAKVAAVTNSQFGEVTWYYPSNGNNENDRYVTWNYRYNYWTIGTLSRTCGVDQGTFDNPILADASGFVYAHEFGLNYSGASAYAETGPIQLGVGDNILSAVQMLPDEKTMGQVTVTFKTRYTPEGPQSTFGPYTISQANGYTDVRFSGRQVSFKVTGVPLTDWRLGNFRLNVTPGGQR